MIRKISPLNKALEINLRADVYGTFAEIGAGQEVARHFFRAGAASGTVAKSMSAYDMIFSDEIYGREESGRYVCESRLERMLDHEYSILLDRLASSRGEDTTFFSFANTMATTSYDGKRRGHGWMGVRYQSAPGAKPSEIILHVNLLDNQALFQQEVVGILGVNLLYSIFEKRSPEETIKELTDNLNPSRIEIDLIRFSGFDYKNCNNALMNMKLVKLGLTKAIMFNEDGKAVISADSLYKKNALVTRGSYRPATLLNEDILNCGLNKFCEFLDESQEDVIKLSELTLTSSSGEVLEEEDFLHRLEVLKSLKQKVMLTNYPEYASLADYFSRFSLKNIGIVLGTYNFLQVFKNNPDERVMNTLGGLLKDNVKVFLYPYKDDENEDISRISNIELEEKYQSLIHYLIDNQQVIEIDDYNEANLHIYSRMVLNMIQAKDETWKDFVSEKVRDCIIEKKLFGHG